MTIEEAIIILKNEQPHAGPRFIITEGQRMEAFDMAVASLSKDCEHVKKARRKAKRFKHKYLRMAGVFNRLRTYILTMPVEELTPPELCANIADKLDEFIMEVSE